MTAESIPAICQECPQAGQNFYTKSWYCVNSGAPLGTKRAWDHCTSPKRAEGPANKANASTGQPSAPEAGEPAGPTTGHATEAGNTAESAPESPPEASGAGSAPQQREAADGDVIPDDLSGSAPREDELVYGYPFDFLFATL